MSNRHYCLAAALTHPLLGLRETPLPSSYLKEKRQGYVTDDSEANGCAGAIEVSRTGVDHIWTAHTSQAGLGLCELFEPRHVVCEEEL